ncbi:MAG TPA: class II aldolase/adducin family protein [Bacteroidales bacterium]|nr:class II aldolase/adducin family protein [Bacteroidales bacterium]
MYEIERAEVAYFMKRLYERGLTTTSGGNVSMRVGAEHVLVTPSLLDKGRLTGEQVGIVTMNGENLTPGLITSMETSMHLAIYKKRPEIRSVVHAHPTWSTTFTAMEKDINTRLIAESWAILGTPVRAAYALQGSPRLAENVAQAAKGSDVILISNHGIVTLGTSLLQAFDRMEVLEAAARMTIVTTIMKDSNELKADQLQEITGI